MTDILVTSPYRPFTLPNQFKAVFNGYIYCGTVDAVDPSVSQVQVYLANEDGSRTPVAQPLRTNAGGYLVYNGQPAKFVTSSNHSLLVRDSLGNQLWYAPDVSMVDPDAAYQIIGAQAFEALRRSYAEAGYNVVGAFQAGFTLVNANDVGIDESTGKGYTGPAGPVAAGTNPATGGFYDVSNMVRPQLSTSLLPTVTGQRVRGVSPQQTVNSAPYGIIDYAGGRRDNLELSGFEFTGPGKSNPSGTIAVKRDGTQNSTRELFESVNFTQYPVGVLHSAGWGQDYSRLSFTQCGTGFKTQQSPIEAGWAGSGYVMSNSYFANCDVGIQDDYIWNATYINVVVENCVEPYVQNTGGTASVWINPWFEDNTNPIRWRRGSVVIGGRNVDYSDIQLFSGRPEDAITDLSRSGISVFRNESTPMFRARGDGVTAFVPKFDVLGWQFKNNAAGDAKLLQVNTGGGVTSEIATSDTTERVATRLTGKVHRFGSQINNMPEMGIEVRGKAGTGGAGTGAIRVVFKTGIYESNGGASTNVADRWAVEALGHLLPQADNTYDVGSASLRGRVAYFGTGTINTSDAREKTAPLPITDEVLDAWGDVQFISFQWLESIREKGDDARWHFGVIAQQVRDAFAARGLDGTRYGLLCYDEWGDEFEPVYAKRDKAVIKQRPIGDTNDLEDYEVIEQEEYDTGEIRQIQVAGSRWGIRADQCLFLEAAYQRRRCDRIEARLSAAGL